MKAESERKIFILQKIPAFSIMPAIKFDEFYRKIITIFRKSKEIVYSETQQANYFYLLYQGSCKLQKNFIRNQHKDSRIIDMKLSTLMNIEKGDVIGLEGLTGSDYYNYTLVSTSDATVLFKINLNKIPQDVKGQFIELHRKKNEILSSFLSKQTFLKEKMRVEYRTLSRSIQQSSRVSIQDIKQEENDNCTELKVIYSNNNSFEKNRLKYRIQNIKTNHNVSIDNFLSNQNFNNITNLNDSKIENLQKPPLDPLEDYKKKVPNKILKSGKLKNDNTSTNHNSIINHNEVNHQITSRPNVFSSSPSLITTQMVHFNQNLSHTEGVSNHYISLDNNDNLIKIFDLKRKAKKSYLNLNLKKVIIEEDIKHRQVENETQKLKKSIYDHLLENPLKNNKEVMKTVVNWKKTFNNKKTPFNSGSFNLPLFVLKTKTNDK